MEKDPKVFGLAEIDKCNSFSGLFLCDKQFNKEEDILVPFSHILDEKIKQQKLYAKTISDSPCTIAINITGSNDLKLMIVDEGSVVPLVEEVEKKWEGLTEHQKVFFNPKRAGLFPKNSEAFIIFFSFIVHLIPFVENFNVA